MVVKKTNVLLYDLREEYGKRHTNLGNARKFYLTKGGRLEIETDLAYQLIVEFSKDDLYRLLYRLIEIRKIELERKAKAKHSEKNI